MCSGPWLGLVVGLVIVIASLHMAGWRDSPMFRRIFGWVPQSVLLFLALDRLAASKEENSDPADPMLIPMRGAAIFSLFVAGLLIALSLFGITACAFW